MNPGNLTLSPDKRPSSAHSSARFFTLRDQVLCPSSFQTIKCPLGRSLIYPHPGNIFPFVEKATNPLLSRFFFFHAWWQFQRVFSREPKPGPATAIESPFSPPPPTPQPAHLCRSASPQTNSGQLSLPDSAGAPSGKRMAAGVSPARPGAPRAARPAPGGADSPARRPPPSAARLGVLRPPGPQDLNSHPLRPWGSSAKPPPLLCTFLRPPSQHPETPPRESPARVSPVTSAAGGHSTSLIHSHFLLLSLLG